MSSPFSRRDQEKGSPSDGACSIDEKEKGDEAMASIRGALASL